MRARTLFFLSHLTRTRTGLLTRYPLKNQNRYVHATSSPNPPQNPFSSQILQNPNPNPKPEVESESESTMNEFLSRFVHSMRPILSQSFPDLNKPTLDSMLLLICKRVVAEIDQVDLKEEEMIDLSEDLWKIIQQVSEKVHEAMKRDKMRNELRKYLHHEDVKEMCRFAGDIGIRGDMLREFRFKWAKEKLEEVEFYRNLEKIRENAEKDKEGELLSVEALPKRKGSIKYKIYGLDLSDEKWREVAERVEEAESKYVKVEAKEVVGRSKRLEDKFFGLDWKKDDLMSVLKEWAEALEARRVDWIALLDRVKERNLDMYFKVAELLLTEESFESNIRDYSRLIDAHLKANHLEDAQRILTKMTEAGIKPDLLTHNILVHLYSKAGNLDQAKASFDNLKNQGFKPDIKAYTSMIKAYVKTGFPKLGESLTRDMEASHIKPTKEIYIELLRAFAELGQVDGAQRILNTMHFAGMQQTLESYTLLVGAYSQAADPDQARVHFDEMMRAGLRPDDRCAASMMTAYAKKNLLDKALELLLTLKREGFKPGVATNMVLVDWFGRLLLVEEAERMLEEIKVEGDVPFDLHVSLCDMYAKAGKEYKDMYARAGNGDKARNFGDKARKSLKILEGRKEMLRADQFDRIVSGLLEGGLVGEANRMYEAMQSLGFQPSEPLKIKLMTAKSSFSRHKPGSRR